MQMPNNWRDVGEVHVLVRVEVMIGSLKCVGCLTFDS